jgi:diguanylate cyclase (GGDEF)-like protein
MLAVEIPAIKNIAYTVQYVTRTQGSIQGAEMPSHNTEILIVDESSNIRATIADYLGDDYIIYYATDGEEGWKLLQANESISLVFTDMHMPVADGMQLLQKIRQANCERIASLPVIIITAADESEEEKQAALNIGATDFINKPFDRIAILSRTRSYSRFNKQVADLEKKAAYDTLTGIYSNHMLLDFGHKTISFAKRHNIDASVLYIEIADTDKLIETYGSKSVETIVSTIAGLLESTIRQEEMVAHLNDGRFAIVLPKTKPFMAHIVASRLKKAVEDLVFDISDIKIQVSLAVGLCSTEVNEASDKIAFEEYCVHAAQALEASLKTPNKRIVRYGDADDDNTGDEKLSHGFLSDEAAGHADNGQDLMGVNADYISGILEGDYSNIPVEDLPSLIESLENFFGYALAATRDNKKASGQ